jgi:diguanylate cyclase (GGDEF)-like protein
LPEVPSTHQTTSLATELAQLRAEIEVARAELGRLTQDLTDARSEFDDSHAAQLVEANEQLVLAMLLAQTHAEAASRAFDAVSRSAELDGLTSLPNRARLHDRLRQGIANAQRHRHGLAVLFLDIDRFKQINDTQGHAAGDEVLKLVAATLTAAVRAVDTVSRYGGDEFVIVLAEVAQKANAAAVARKLGVSLSAASLAAGHAFELAASIGVSLYPDDAEDPQALIDLADGAMYRAKRHKPGSVAFHSSATPEAPHEAHQRPAPAADEVTGLHADLREVNAGLVLAALNEQDMRLAAEMAQRRQTELMALVAHELRNPLNPIRNAAALLSRVASDEPMLRRVQAVIERQVAHLARLVGDLLDVSRAHTGKLRLETLPVDLSQLIDEAVLNGQPAMDLRGQRFRLHTVPGPIQVLGDAVRLAQVLGNLLDNAVKYTPDGGWIDVAVTVDGADVVLSVSDSGIGIAAESLHQIFEPFVQDQQATRFNSQGLGIGLTVVRELVLAHGGQVEAHSGGEGRGSRFVVTLPLVQGSASR